MIGYVLIFVIGFAAVSLWSTWLVTHPKTIESGVNPKNFNMPFEDIALETKDGVSISGWFITPEISSAADKKPALVILHGYPAEKGDMLYIASRLHPDFNIILIDLRSFGKSGGIFTTLGNKERLDLSSALDFLESRGFTKAGVIGFSLGGAAAILTAADDPRIAAVASYASFADLTLLGHEVYSKLFILRYPLVELMKLWGKLFWNIDPALSPRHAASRLMTPIIIIHSKQDEQISFRHAEILQDSLKNNKLAEFYFIDEGRHGELPRDFEERVKDFFLKSL